MEILTPGRTLVCEIADFDACDRYLFSIDDLGAALTVSWKLKGCSDHGVVHVAKKAVEGGTRLIGFGQGNVSRWRGAAAESTEECKDGCDCHTLPFTLGRAAFDGLEKGKSIELNVFGEVASFVKKGKAKREIQIDGKACEVDCLHAAGSEGELWIIDDAKCPVIARVEVAGGENYCELQIASKRAPAELEAEL
jgi:hypothetical protein